MKVAARVGGSWTKDYNLGVWAEDTGTVRRHSVAGQGDALGAVDTDTLELEEPADALRLRVVLFSESTATPVLRAASAIATKRGASAPEPLPVQAAWGKTLPVPKRSQMIYPGGGEAWCSPTSTSMLLSYWADALSAPALQEAPPEAATRCHDVVYGGTGNWPFNTAHASALGGGRLHGIVTRLSSIAQLERLVAAGVPAAISVRYGPGELARAPITSTAGHLVVVAGFTEDGDVVCNDPAFASDASVEVVYARAALFTAWQRSLGTTYVLWPSGTSLPTDPLGAYR